MSAHPNPLTEKMFRLDTARNEIGVTLFCSMTSLITLFIIYKFIINAVKARELQAMISLEATMYMFLSFAAVFCLHVLWKIIIYSDVIFLTQAKIKYTYNHCTCGPSVKEGYLILRAKFTCEDTSHSRERLLINCSACGKLCFSGEHKKDIPNGSYI